MEQKIKVIQIKKKKFHKEIFLIINKKMIKK